MTSIGSHAFDSCTNLASVTLPATLFLKENYSDYSLLAEQVRVEKTSIDAFVANAEAASRTLGQQDVTASPSVYDLHTSTELAEATAAARTIVNVSARVALGEG